MNEIEQLFAQQSTTAIARQLLGMYLEHETPSGKLGGYIVDCEAYLGPEDLAAHSFGMRNTPRVRAMYEKPGTIYLYTMHTHLILNFITQPEGIPQGIMIRGVEPVEGIAQMEINRSKSGPDLSNGPGKLVKALGITPDYYGHSILQVHCILSTRNGEHRKKYSLFPESVSRIKGSGPISRCGLS